MEKAVVLVGGSGRGVKPITGGKPKSLIRLAGKSVIERILENLIKCRVREVILVSDQPSYFEDVTVAYGRVINVELVKQVGSDILGAILSAKELITKDTLLVYGDTLVPHEAFETVINAYLTYGKPILMVIPEEDVKLYGAVLIDSLNRVVDFVEKPSTDIAGAYAFGGISVVSKELITVFEESSSVDEGIKKYVSGKGSVVAAIWSGWWVDIGFPWDILKANYYVLSGLNSSIVSSKASIASSVIVRGPVVIEEDAVVDHYVVLNGPLYIGRGCEVGTHSLVGKYSSLEGDNYVDTFSEVFWSSLQPRSNVGRGSYLYLTVVGEGATVESCVTTYTGVKKEIAIPNKGVTIGKNLMNYLKNVHYVEYGGRLTSSTRHRTKLDKHVE